MGKRKGGPRRKSRQLMRKQPRTKGKISLSKYYAEYKPGEKVVLKAEPAVQQGLFHLRFYGKTGIVVKKQGKCYAIQITDGNTPKIVITHPIHLRRL